MKTVLALSILTVLAESASATPCVVAGKIISEYGVSFSGFMTSIPSATPPDENAIRSRKLVTVPLPNPKGMVPDGYFHYALIDKKQKRAWIHRVGGFLIVNEWYGPIALPSVDFSGCNVEREQN